MPLKLCRHRMVFNASNYLTLSRRLSVWALAYIPAANAQADPAVFGWVLAKALIVTILLLGAAFLLLKGYAHWHSLTGRIAPAKKSISVVERLRLSQKATLYTVCWGETEYLLAETGQQLTVIDKKTKENEVKA